ncbi:MAG: hypothetical protein WKG00_14970 [Polyangiaceae bacterium]
MNDPVFDTNLDELHRDPAFPVCQVNGCREHSVDAFEGVELCNDHYFECQDAAEESAADFDNDCDREDGDREDDDLEVEAAE